MNGQGFGSDGEPRVRAASRRLWLDVSQDAKNAAHRNNNRGERRSERSNLKRFTSLSQEHRASRSARGARVRYWQPTFAKPVVAFVTELLHITAFPSVDEPV